MFINLRSYWDRLPDFSLSHILLRIPLASVFIQQGLAKLPFDPAFGSAMGISSLVWWVVVYGEIAAGIGLLIGALATVPGIRNNNTVAVLGDVVTRFCGITMCCIVTGVIWMVLKPTNLIDFVLYDYVHLSLWIGGLYFALRGNWAAGNTARRLHQTSTT